MATGFLTRSIARVRLLTDEPSISAKYSDANIIDFLESSWADVWADLNRVSSHPIVVRHDIDVTSKATLETNTYILPPTVGTVLRLAKINTSDGSVAWERFPRSRWNAAGPGVAIEGATVVFEPWWQLGTHTLRLVYLPTGDVRLHEGDAGTITNDTSANTCMVVLASSPTTGELDMRPNAYAGSILRLLSNDADSEYPVQERVIRSYDYATRTATIYPALTEAPSSGTTTYEIAPLMGQGFDMVVALDVAAIILGVEGDHKRAAQAEKQYARKMRSVRLNAINLESIIGTRFIHDTAAAESHVDW